MNNLRTLRTEAGETQEEVAMAVDVSPLTYGAWERGGVIPTPPNTQKLADYFGVSVADLGLAPARQPGRPKYVFSAGYVAPGSDGVREKVTTE